jgi:hypothetical protein
VEVAYRDMHHAELVYGYGVKSYEDSQDCQVERSEKDTVGVVHLNRELRLYRVLHPMLVFIPIQSPMDPLPNIIPLIFRFILSDLKLLGVVEGKVKRTASIEVYMKFMFSLLLPFNLEQLGDFSVHLDRYKESSPDLSR